MERECRELEMREGIWATRNPEETVHEIRSEWMRGMSFTQIARKHLIDPRTAKRYATKNISLSELGHRSRSMLDPYRDFIGQWMDEGASIAVIRRRLYGRWGVKCGYMTVSDYLDKLRRAAVKIV